MDPNIGHTLARTLAVIDVFQRPCSIVHAQIDSLLCFRPVVDRISQGTHMCVPDSYEYIPVCSEQYRIRHDSSWDDYKHLEIWVVLFDSHLLLATLTVPDQLAGQESQELNPVKETQIR